MEHLNSLKEVVRTIVTALLTNLATRDDSLKIGNFNADPHHIWLSLSCYLNQELLKRIPRTNSFILRLTNPKRKIPSNFLWRSLRRLGTT